MKRKLSVKFYLSPFSSSYKEVNFNLGQKRPFKKKKPKPVNVQVRAVPKKETDLLSWHRAIRKHPIADPNYAKENLVSLLATLVMLLLYASIFILCLHYLVLIGLIRYQSIPWALVEGSTKYLLYKAPYSIYEDRLSILVAIAMTVVAAWLVRYSFEIIKAMLHPKGSVKSRKLKSSKVKS